MTSYRFRKQGRTKRSAHRENQEECWDSKPYAVVLSNYQLAFLTVYCMLSPAPPLLSGAEETNLSGEERLRMQQIHRYKKEDVGETWEEKLDPVDRVSVGEAQRICLLPKLVFAWIMNM